MRLSETLKRSFVAGIVLLAPLVVTVFVLLTAFRWLATLVNPIVQGTRLTRYTANIEVVAQLLAIVIVVAVLMIIGYVAQRGIGRRVFGSFGRTMDFIPLVSVVYASTRQVANALVQQRTSYESVVFVEYPREGVYAIGFVTGKAHGSADEAAGEPVYNVFLPNSPNPTAGRLALVPESQLSESDMSVREGLRTVVTTGMGDRAPPTMLPDASAPVEQA